MSETVLNNLIALRDQMVADERTTFASIAQSAIDEIAALNRRIERLVANQQKVVPGWGNGA